MGRAQERVFVVDDEPSFRETVRAQLEDLGYLVSTFAGGEPVLAAAAKDGPPALVILDVVLPGLSGLEVLTRLKALHEDPQVVMVSGHQDLDTVRQSLHAGAYDYLAKPFEIEDLANTVERALERRRLLRQNREYQENLERMVQERTAEVHQTIDVALLTLARLAESRDRETGQHLERMAAYSQLLARRLLSGPYSDTVDEEFVEWLYKSSPLHDIGKVAIPDRILRKEGPLTAEETEVMRRHTVIGGDTLRSVLERYQGSSFLAMAMEIAYSHHERWDGDGYPRGLAGERIPLSGRIVALADAYDAITSRRSYKPALSHAEAVRRIEVERDGHFDPVLVDAFLASRDEFEWISLQHVDPVDLPEPLS